MTTDKRAQVAQELAALFTTGTRADGSSYVYLKDGSPEWASDIVHAAHGDMLPDDWRYKMIRCAADALNDREPDNWEDAAGEIADDLVDVYNRPRLQWLAARLDRAYYCDEAVSQGLADGSDMFATLGAGQYMEYSEILQALIQAINERADELEDEAEDEAEEAEE